VGVARRTGTAAYRRFYRLGYVAISILTLLPVLALVWWLPDRQIYAIPAPWVYATLLIQAAAAAGVAVGVLQTGAMDFLGLRQFLRDREAEETPLVTSGLYRYVRHPLYSFSYLFLWLMPVMRWNLLALTLAFSVYLWLGSILEERKLVAAFGARYQQYQQVTPRFLPIINRRTPAR
jgi:protein-S-isoprenylcysteine O-methyltransferase Ste14